jgi:hypothetical protein
VTERDKTPENHRGVTAIGPENSNSATVSVVQSADDQNAVTRETDPMSRRDSHVTSPVSHGCPDPTRPDHYVKGGGLEPTEAPNTPPPRRCATHQTWPADATIPPCGPCADARRNYEAWRTQQTPRNPHDEQQAAARARRQRNCDTCNGAGVWMPPDSDVAHPCPDCT